MNNVINVTALINVSYICYIYYVTVSELKEEDQEEHVLDSTHQSSRIAIIFKGQVYHSAQILGLISCLMTREEMVHKTLVYSPFNYLTWLLA